MTPTLSANNPPSFELPLWPPHFGLPENHCLDVFKGSYDTPFNPTTPPVILDIGANVGAFCRWAVKRWPGCTIHAYEPCPYNFDLLGQTMETLPAQHVIAYRRAVAEQAGTATLNEGQFNCGEWSLMMRPIPGKRSVEVQKVAAMTLPKADILKIDAEGAELEIIAALLYGGRLPEFSAIMMEVHSAAWVEPFREKIGAQGFTLTGENIHAEHRREMKWVRSDLLK
jgi:FkbM family methyltransferase